MNKQMNIKVKKIEAASWSDDCPNCGHDLSDPVHGTAEIYHYFGYCQGILTGHCDYIQIPDKKYRGVTTVAEIKIEAKDFFRKMWCKNDGQDYHNIYGNKMEKI